MAQVNVDIFFDLKELRKMIRKTESVLFDYTVDDSNLHSELNILGINTEEEDDDSRSN